MILSSLAILLPASGREWTDTETGRKVEAEYVSSDGEQVKIQRQSDGKSFSLSLAKLSEADRSYVSQRMADKTENELDPGSDSDVDTSSSRRSREADATKFTSYTADWPSQVKVAAQVDVQVVSEDDTEKKYVYRSAHYEYICDVQLSQSVVGSFARLFEATYEYVKLLPLGMRKPHLEGEHFKILLFEHHGTYVSNGAPPESAGVYMSRGDLIMVPLTSLGVKKVGSRYMRDRDHSNKTLPHEIAHQLTDRKYYSEGARGWFTEGLAEYVGVTPFRSGIYSTKQQISAVKDYVTAYGRDKNGGRALGDEIRMAAVQDFMLMPYSSFTADANRNYGCGLLLTYYFFHMDGDGERVALNHFLKALQDGKKGQEAIDALLMGRTYEQLQEQIAKAWKSRGVKIHFDGAR